MMCQKLQLQPDEKLQDIGCGWGGLAWYAATHFDVQVLGITVSAQQQQYARERCAGLLVEIELIDYRDLQGQYDKVVSVGMYYLMTCAAYFRARKGMLWQLVFSHRENSQVYRSTRPRF